MVAHIAVGTGVGAVTLVVINYMWLIRYAIGGTEDHWHRFRNFSLFVIWLLLLVGWWLFGDGGMQVVIIDIGRVSAALRGNGERLPP